MNKFLLIIILAAAGGAAYYGGSKSGLVGVAYDEQRLIAKAEQNSLVDIVKLANAYDMGLFGTQDSVKAKKWLDHAIQQHGSTEAHYLLGIILLEGREGVIRDRSTAHTHLSVAANSGIPMAFYQLGQMQENGWGVSRNYEQAFYSYNMAARLGVPEASENAGRMGERIPEKNRVEIVANVNRDEVALKRLRDSQLSRDLLEIISFRGDVNR